METDSRANARLQYVSERFPQLKGLILIPLSLLFLASGGYEAGLFRMPGDAAPNGPGRWFMVGLALVIAAHYPITAWYRRRLGVAPQSIKHSQLLPILAGIAVLPIGAAIQGSLPFNAPIALLALVVGAYGVRDYPFRRHYLASAAALLAYSLHRLLGVPAAAVGPLLNTSIGVALATAGVGDHLLLVSTLEPVEVYV